MIPIPILISLAAIPDRREGMVRQFSALGWDYILNDACDCREAIPKDAIVDREVFASLYKRKIRNGEVGCYISHLNALEDGLSRGYNWIWVVEDDVVLMSEYAPAREAIYGAMREIDSFGTDSWILYLSRPIMHGSLRELPHSFPDLNFCRPIEVGSVGTQSYILSAGAAHFVLDYLKVVDRPIDEKLRYWQMQGRIMPFILRKDLLPIRPNWDIESVIAPNAA